MEGNHYQEAIEKLQDAIKYIIKSNASISEARENIELAIGENNNYKNICSSPIQDPFYIKKELHERIDSIKQVQNHIESELDKLEED